MLRKPFQKGVNFVRRQQSPFKLNMVRLIVQNFSVGLTQQYQSIYISELGAGPLQLGYVTGIGGIASTIITVPAGWLADRYGIKKMVLTSITLGILGYAIFALAGHWWVTAAALLATTFSWQIGMTVCPMICGSTLASSERTTGMQLCDTVTAMPRLIAPIVAAYLITLFGGMSVEGIRPLYWIEVSGLVIAFLIFFRYFTDPLGRKGGQPHQLMAGLRRVLNEGVMVKRWIVFSILSVFPLFMSIFIPLYARELKGATQYTIGLMDAAFYLLIVLLAIPVGLSADRFGRKKLIILMTPLYCLSLLLIVYAPNTLVLIVAGFLNGFLWISLVTQGSIMVELVPRELLGSWSGILGLFRGMVMIASPIMGGMIWKSIGPEYVFYFLVGTQILRLTILASMPSSIIRG